MATPIPNGTANNTLVPNLTGALPNGSAPVPGLGQPLNLNPPTSTPSPSAPVPGAGQPNTLGATVPPPSSSSSSGSASQAAAAATPGTTPAFGTGSDSASLYNTGPQWNPPVTMPTAPPNADTSASTNYQNIINGQIGQLQQPVSANSPYIQAQTNAYDLSAQRSATQAQEAAAQAGYAQGDLNSGSQNVQQMLINEALGQGEATNTGNVMATAEAQRQAQLANMIGVGTTQAQNQQQLTAGQNQYASTLGLNVAGLKETAGAQAVSAAQQQQVINDALAAAIAQQQLGYYNTNATTGTNAAVAAANAPAGA